MKLPLDKFFCHWAKVVFIILKTSFSGIIHVVERKNNAEFFSVITGHELAHFDSRALTFADGERVVL